MNSSRSRSVFSKASSPACRLPRPRPHKRAPPPAAAVPEPVGPDAPHLPPRTASSRPAPSLSDQEKLSANYPFDGYEKLKAQARANEPPKPDDNFRWRFLRTVLLSRRRSTSYMCRLRIPERHPQRRRNSPALPMLAERFGGGYAHVTTRANLQLREIEPKNAVDARRAASRISACARAAPAPTTSAMSPARPLPASIRRNFSTRGLYAREWHFHVLNDRTLYGLPRKFNVGFDGGGVHCGAGGYERHRLSGSRGQGRLRRRARRLVSPRLGGITGHKDFARETGVIVKPAESDARWPTRWCGSSSKMATAPTAPRRGSNTFSMPGASRNSSRRWRKSLAASWRASPPRRSSRGRPIDRTAHIGVHAQKQPGLNWIGVALPVGRMTGAQMRGLAAVARRFRRRRPASHRLAEPADLGRCRRRSRRRKRRSRRSASAPRPTSLRAGLVACTGNTGCKFAASDTKRHAAEIADRVRYPRRDRYPGEHPPHRLPSLLRAALHRRHRSARLQGSARARMAIRSRATTSLSAAALVPMPRSAARSIATSRQPMCRAPSSACSRLTWRTAASPQESFLSFAGRYDDDALKALFEARDASNDRQSPDPPDPAGERPVHAGTTGLAQWLLRGLSRA